MANRRPLILSAGQQSEITTADVIDPAVLPTATASALGAVRPDGTTITISGAGVLSGFAPSAPIAADTITVIQNTAISPNGLVAVVGNNASVPPATEGDSWEWQYSTNSGASWSASQYFGDCFLYSLASGTVRLRARLNGQNGTTTAWFPSSSGTSDYTYTAPPSGGSGLTLYTATAASLAPGGTITVTHAADASNKRIPALFATIKTNVLCHFDGANGATGATDSGGSHTVTLSGTASLATGAKEFGTASLSLPGSSASGATVAPTSGDLTLSGDFYIDLWANATTWASNPLVWMNTTDPSNFVGIYAYSSGLNAVVVVGGAYNVQITASVPSTSAWHHIAFGRKGNNWYFWIDGVLQGSTTYSGSVPATTNIYIGYSSALGTSRAYQGYIDEFHALLGYCPFTTTFTVPSSAYSGTSIQRNVTSLMDITYADASESNVTTATTFTNNTTTTYSSVTAQVQM